MKIINRITTRLSGFTELVIFFFFLTTSLFLGDGKQPFVDVWWALGILMMYGVRYYQRGKLDLRPLPRSIGWAWVALILYYVILAPFSDSAGYSITATIRLIEAYLVYLLFYTITSDRIVALFAKGLLFVGALATFASFVFLLVPSWASFLPPMNLLYATYGHNHLADLLLFVFPVAIGLVEKKRSIGSIGLLVLFVIGMLLTFARGAWILLVLYLVFLYLKNKSPYLKKIVLVGAAVLVAVFLAVSLLSRNGASAVLAQNVPRLARLIQKPSLLEDGRWEYWRQAIEAIKERPLFGSGPGTFYLQSKRLQSRPSSYSWFAHSFPLETMVEFGPVGLLIYLFLFYVLFRRVQANPLLWGVVLVFIYSFYEFALDYAAMWLLVWAALGTLTKQVVQTTNQSKVTAVALIVLMLFYASSVGSVMASVAGNQALAFFLVPYDVNTTKELLDEQKTTGARIKNTTLRLVEFFHRKNPEVLFSAIDMGSEDFSDLAYKQALLYDSGNIEKYKRYVRFLIEQNNTTNLWDAITRLGKLELPAHVVSRLQKITLPEPSLSNTQKDELTEPFFGAYGVGDRYSKIFYLLGALSMDDNLKATEELWKLSRDLAPWWAHYHLELAGLYYWKLRDVAAAAEALQVCRRNIYAGRYCAEKGNNLSLLPQPGVLKDKIVVIPR